MASPSAPSASLLLRSLLRPLQKQCTSQPASIRLVRRALRARTPSPPAAPPLTPYARNTGKHRRTQGHRGSGRGACSAQPSPTHPLGSTPLPSTTNKNTHHEACTQTSPPPVCSWSVCAACGFTESLYIPLRGIVRLGLHGELVLACRKSINVRTTSRVNRTDSPPLHPCAVLLHCCGAWCD